LAGNTAYGCKLANHKLVAIGHSKGFLRSPFPTTSPQTLCLPSFPPTTGREIVESKKKGSKKKVRKTAKSRSNNEEDDTIVLVLILLQDLQANDDKVFC
jgi:hypothetical protein